MPRAPRLCPATGCNNRITNRRYCEDHTAYGWAGRSHASGAAHIRWSKAVRQRDKECQLRFNGCTGDADEADHIVNVKAGGARYDPKNGQGACTHCHGVKTRAEAHRARLRASKN
ncbi:HNH endonuclease [Leucobacter sp. cx-42]|uniref:HNH endonuclease n=1 Tax=unclassified Leucobacter TaxID=2621730 RepID=UPI00165E1AF1|nr:HNH endonuclease [Leucobacter sp. cx-42]